MYPVDLVKVLCEKEPRLSPVGPDISRLDYKSFGQHPAVYTAASRTPLPRFHALRVRVRSGGVYRVLCWELVRKTSAWIYGLYGS